MQSHYRHSASLGVTRAPANIGAFSWAAYWSTQTEVLFFGQIKNITGDKLYNEKRGATDYLTVAGAAGSYTFQAPVTAAYKAADTDYIWFKTDETPRTTTEAELIGYDLQHTPVKYDDEVPNTLRWICILSSDITGDKLNKLFSSFHLPIEWHNDTNAYGHIKSNRTGQNLWTPESVYQTESNALFLRMDAVGETPDGTRKGVIDTAIAADKAAIGFTNKYDAFWLTAAHGNDSGLLNIIKDAHNLTLVNTPAFTIDRGYAGNETDAALCANYNPSTQHSKLLQNSASIGVYIRTNIGFPVSSGDVFCASDGGLNGIWFRPITGSDMYASCNSAYGSYSNAYSRGMWIITRVNSTEFKIYHNGIYVVTITENSTSLVNVLLYFLCRNISGTLGTYGIYEIALAFAGTGMSQAEVTAFQTIWVDGYLNTLGAKV